MIRTAFFDTKTYDIPSFQQYGEQYGIEFRRDLPDSAW